MTSHLNRLNEMVQMMGHNIWFRREIRKIIIKHFLLSRTLNMLSDQKVSASSMFCFSSAIFAWDQLLRFIICIAVGKASIQRDLS